MGERNKYQVVIEITTEGDDEEYVMDSIQDLIDDLKEMQRADQPCRPGFRGWNATVKKIRKEK